MVAGVCVRVGWACPDKLVLQVGNNPFLYDVDFTFEEDVWYHIGIVQVKQVWVRAQQRKRPPQNATIAHISATPPTQQATTIKVYINGALIQTMQVALPPPIHGNISLTFGTHYFPQGPNMIY